MFRPIKINLHSLFPLVLFASVAFTQTYYYCNVGNRPNEEDCLKEAKQDTCGFYKTNCPLSICGMYAFNGCHACSMPYVYYYEKKNCDPDVIVETCFKGICDPKKDPRPYVSLLPACGFLPSDDGKYYPATFKNVCQLCEYNDSPYYRGSPFYQLGACRQDRMYCEDPGALDVWDDSDNTVCAYFNSKDFGLVYTTVYNNSEACADPAVEFWLRYACGPSKDNKKYCLPNVRREHYCAIAEPACGFYKDESGNLAHKVMESGCKACEEPGILYHTPGPCNFSCEGVDFRFCDGDINPVCGTYEENGERKTVSLQNKCIACSLKGKKIISFSEGLCPGDRGISCERTELKVYGYWNPVCGYSRKSCKSSGTWKTYTEPLDACSAKNNGRLYLPGPCEGDEGVPCDDFRVRPEKPRFVYEDVCGYYLPGCRNVSCKAVYNDQYSACANSRVIYFTKEPCL